MEQLNIVELTKTTAKNMSELLLQLADHIDQLEKENVELKRKLDSQADDFK